MPIGANGLPQPVFVADEYLKLLREISIEKNDAIINELKDVNKRLKKILKLLGDKDED